MNVFTDFHHAGLLNSLIMLFEHRFGWNVYRPIGEEWHINGFWKVYDHPATVQQYLSIGGATPDGTKKLNEVRSSENGFYLCKDISSGKENKAITLDAFKDTYFKLVIASIPDHIIPFRQLIDKYKPGAKLVFQIGNSWNISPEQEQAIDYILSSAKLNHPVQKPFVEYHQEFDLSIFKKAKKETGNVISSLLNCPESFPEWGLFTYLESSVMPNWIFRAHGGQGRDGVLAGDTGVAEAIENSRFIWHVKKGGDGYGHILHNTAAMGKPMIVNKSYYDGKLGEKLLIPDKTCVDINGLGAQEIANKISYFSEKTRYKEMCDFTYKNFHSKVSFDDDFKNIRDLFAEIL